ncbi:hypothetical protein ACWEO2_13685 [Nocardia sp. NPDC004278]
MTEDSELAPVSTVLPNLPITPISSRADDLWVLAAHSRPSLTQPSA